MENLTESPDFDLRYTAQDDEKCLKKWLMPKEMRLWYPVSSDADIEIFTKNWIGFYRFGASLTALYKGEPVGIGTLFLMPYRKLIHHSLMYFIVDPEKKGHGFGTALLKNITHLGKTYFRFEKIHLETYEGCPGLSLLEKAGYHKVVRQEGFVKEDSKTTFARVIMEVDLKS